MIELDTDALATSNNLHTAGRNSLMRLVEDHRNSCNGDCNIALYWIRRWLISNGITLTYEEERLFI